MAAAGPELENSGVDPYVDAYERAQEQDGRADLAAFLPGADHPLYADVLCELIRVDLEYGWMRGQPRRLAEYQTEFPALFRRRELVRAVAFEEWRLRCQAGEDAAPGDYQEFGIEEFDRPPSARRAPEPIPDHQDAAGAPTPLSLAEGLEDAARLYHRHNDGAPDDVFRTLYAADPPTARHVAQALGEFPAIGTEFAGFRLLRELGRGAFGRVYLAMQPDLAGRLVALKVSAEPGAESATLAQLQHANVVPIHSAHQVGPFRAVCMPYCGATTLADVLRSLRGRGAVPDSGEAFVFSRGLLQP